MIDNQLNLIFSASNYIPERKNLIRPNPSTSTSLSPVLMNSDYFRFTPGNNLGKLSLCHY